MNIKLNFKLVRDAQGKENLCVCDDNNQGLWLFASDALEVMRKPEGLTAIFQVEEKEL